MEMPLPDAAVIARRDEIAAALRQIVPGEGVIVSEPERRAYESDGLTAYRQPPLVVVLPSTVAQVAQVLRYCQAEVTNLGITAAVEAAGFYYAPDPSSQIACTIGGNVAENSGGVHCLKYGLTLHNVLRLRGLTIDGEPLEVGAEAPDAPGLDLLALAIGSEGMLFVVTEVAVKLLPKPQCAQVIMASFDDVEKAGDAVAAVIAAGIIPAGLEMMDRPATRAVEQFVAAGYDLDAAAILLCESDGTPDEVAHEIARMKAVLEGAGA